MNQLFKRDFSRYTNKEWSAKQLFRVLSSSPLRYLWYGRKYQVSNSKIKRKFYLTMLKLLGKKMGNEIAFESIGQGLVLMHPYGITVNPHAVLGEDVTLFKGSTIGSIRSGKRCGCPIIGNRVVLACNAMVCGGIKIGDDVLIAAGAFVDFDVPDNSVVIGNPGVIHSKSGATKDYL